MVDRRSDEKHSGGRMSGTTVAWLCAGVALVVTAGASIAMAPTARVMRRRGAGIVALELARTDTRAREILTGWGAPGKDAARRNTYWDFKFLVGYGALLAAAWIGCRQSLHDHVGAWLGAASLGFAIAAVVAALLDAAEDVALLVLLSRSDGAGVGGPAGWAFGFAVAKWLLVGLAAAALLPAVVAVLAACWS